MDQMHIFDDYIDKISQIILMQQFRIKPSTSQGFLHRSHSPQQKRQQIFPFSNLKLKRHGRQEDGVSIKRFKSNIQISRKNYQFIPNLKKVTLDNQKIQIVKSANQYNIFMKKSQSKINNAQNAAFINGSKIQNKTKGLLSNSKLYKFTTIDSNPQKNILLYTNRFQRWADFASNNSQIALKVAGQAKQISPSRCTARERLSNTVYKEYS